MHELNEKVSLAPSRAKRLLVRAATGLAITVVGCAALLLAAASLPRLFGFASLVVLSGSMEPAIRVGDMAVARGVDPTTVGVGEIVTYRSGSHFVTHRIIRVQEGPQGRLFQLKGDNNPSPDSALVREDQVIAKVVYSVPKVGYLVAFANSQNGLILLIVTPAVVLALMWYHERQQKKASSQPQGAAAPSSEVEVR